MTGVDWKGPGRVPYSSIGTSLGSHFHTISSSPTFEAVISSAAEYLVCAWSEPTNGQSAVTSGSWATCERHPNQGGY